MSRTEGIRIEDPRSEDLRARRAAQEVFDRPLVIEAGAGTGKTTVLIARLLAWSLGPGWTRAASRPASAASPGAAATTVVDPAAAGARERIAAAVMGGVAAITFTEAAAAEMAERAARELGRLAAGERPPEWLAEDLLPEPGERRARARALLATLDHLTVRTIHSFCFGLLSSHPLEAGVHPELTVDATGDRLAELARETVEAALPAGYGDPGDPHLLALAERGFGPPEVVEALIALVTAGLDAGDLDADPFAPAPWRACCRRLVRAATAVHDLLAPRLAVGGRKVKAHEVADALAGLLAALDAAGGAPSPEELPALVARHFDDGRRQRLKEWGKRLGNATEERLLADCRQELAVAAPALAALLEHALRLDRALFTAGREALRPLLTSLNGELSRRGIATFESLLTGASRLLTRHSEVAAREAGRIDQLLVDEFQDTDRVQCALLAALALSSPAGRRPGLFLVGDPKQSIYGWRSADLAAYEGFVVEVVKAGGEVHTLSVNFRSAPPILDEVARVMTPVMRESPGLQPAFQPLLACDRLAGARGFDEAGWAPVEHWVSWEKAEAGPAGAPGAPRGGARTRAGAAVALEAAAVADDVARLERRFGVPLSEVAILLRAASDLDVYLEALRQKAIPFAVARDKQYYRRREVIDAAALVRAVLDAGDHLALVTVLRSPWVGVPDAALVPLWRAGFPRAMTELAAPDPRALADLRRRVEAAAGATPREVPGIERVAGWEVSLLAAVENLALLRAAYGEDPAERFVERLRALFLPEVTEAARYLGPYRLANLNRFFRELEAAIEEGGGDAAAVLRALRTSVASAREAEEGRPPSAEQNAVQVMTIHGAKGLDFDHVYLVELHHQDAGRREAGRTEAAQLAGEAGWELCLFGAPGPGFDRVEAERARVEAAERVRTLYVAMTRARQRTVLAGLWPDPVRRVPPELARTHLELLASRPDVPDLAAGFAGAAAGGGAHTDPGGVLFRFPAWREPGTELAAEDGEAAALPTAEEVALTASLLQSQRADALLRQARPVTTPASEEAHARLREELAERRAAAAEGAETSRESLSREAAMAVGGAFHRLLETWDLAAPAGEEEARQRQRIPAYLEALLPDGSDLEPAARRVGELFDRFRAGGLLARFLALGEAVLARELPILLPPSGEEEGAAPVGAAVGAAVGAIVGAIDLLYRDPDTGRLVVADYKTDQVTTAEEVARRAHTYAPQGMLYARAVAEALDLAEPPRCELWMVHAGRVVVVA